MSFTQKRRAGIIADCYEKWDISGKKVLDIGCGNGVVSDVLRKRLKLQLYGTDVIDYRKIDTPFKQIKKNDRLPFDDSAFDFAMFNDVLHHIADVETFIVEAGRVSRIILIFEDQPTFFLKAFDIIVNHFYSSQISPAINFKTEGQWSLLFRKLGFEYDIGEIAYPFWYPFRHMAFRLRRGIQNAD